jgi:hypothetical protein
VHDPRRQHPRAGNIAVSHVSQRAEATITDEGRPRTRARLLRPAPTSPRGHHQTRIRARGHRWSHQGGQRWRHRLRARRGGSAPIAPGTTGHRRPDGGKPTTDAGTLQPTQCRSPPLPPYRARQRSPIITLTTRPPSTSQTRSPPTPPTGTVRSGSEQADSGGALHYGSAGTRRPWHLQYGLRRERQTTPTQSGGPAPEPTARSTPDSTRHHLVPSTRRSDPHGAGGRCRAAEPRPTRTSPVSRSRPRAPTVRVAPRRAAPRRRGAVQGRPPRDRALRCGRQDREGGAHQHHEPASRPDAARLNQTVWESATSCARATGPVQNASPGESRGSVRESSGSHKEREWTTCAGGA